MIRSSKVKARNISMTVNSPARKAKGGRTSLVHAGCGAFEKNKQARLGPGTRGLPPVIATSFKNSGVIRLVQQYQEVSFCRV